MIPKGLRKENLDAVSRTQGYYSGNLNTGHPKSKSDVCYIQTAARMVSHVAPSLGGVRLHGMMTS